MKFDGKAFAREIEQELIYKVRNLVTKPKIVSFLVGDDPASTLYTRLKKEAAERVGVQFEIENIDIRIQTPDLIQKLREVGAREEVSGVMVQLPLPTDFKGATLKVLETISLNKDVDGLRYPESGVIPPVVKAILLVLDKIALDERIQTLESRIVVMGAKGSVGSALCSELKKREVEVIEVDSETEEPTRMILEGEVVISCVGKEGVVSGEMVKNGAIVIDVGAPKGDMTREAYDKASVSVEVPGGVGPVTIACLLQNAVEVCGK